MIQVLVMYETEKSGPMFCLGKDWDRVKKTLSGMVQYAKFQIPDKSPLTIARKIRECQEGNAHACSGGVINLKKSA